MILVIQGWLPHYRLEVFNALCNVDDVTVVHSGKPARRPNDRFLEIILPVDRIGPFSLQRGLSSLIEETRPDATIAMFDIRWLNSVRAMYRYDRQIPWVWWGLDAGKSKLALHAKLAIARRPNPIVFYDVVTRERIGLRIADSDKMFVANNTFHVPNRVKGHLNAVKNRFINVGSLDARKQNDIAIRALANIVRDTRADIRLTLIGDGPERENLQALAQSLGIEDRVELVGQVNDALLLSRYYAESYASVSFGQAGLAVLQSMAFGVPFITKRNAISGGEKFNISDGRNGYFCKDDPSDLERIMRDLVSNPENARQLGCAAFEYYSTAATIDNMVASFERAIAFARDRHASRLS